LKLRDILFRNAVITDLKPDTKDEILKRLGAFLCSLNNIEDSEQVISGLLNRESEMSTGIGFGIAVPHIRTAAAKNIHLAVARCVEGIEYEAIDDRPVKLIFMLIVPKERSGAYQDILQSISTIMLYETMRDSLLAAETADELVEILNEGEEKYSKKD